MSAPAGEQPREIRSAVSGTDSAEPYCLRCGYNLRGLAGDPVRCPECGLEIARQALHGRGADALRRGRELLTALDVCLISLLVLAAGCVVSLLRLWLPWSLALGVVAPAAGGCAAVFEIRRLCGPHRGWPRAAGSCLLWTGAIATLVPGLWAAAGLACWRGLLIGVPAWRVAVAAPTPPGEGWYESWLVALVAGGGISAVVFAWWNPYPRLRRGQARAFRRLLVYARAERFAEQLVDLQQGQAPASLSSAMRQSVLSILGERLAAAVARVSGTAPGEIDPQVRAAGDPRFGDYQCNVAMSLARRLGLPPRELAERIVAAAELADIAEQPEIAGPGFVNLRLRSEFLCAYLEAIPAPPRTERSEQRGLPADRLGLPPTDRRRTIVVDYSQPNIAKQMHVGHLRSTIIGDALVRVLMLQGHKVVRQNHIGDWGTQFGMLIRWYREHPLPTPGTCADVLEALEADYQAANARFESDPQFAAEARRAVVALQSGEPQAREVWSRLCAASWRAFTEIYERLGVLLEPADVRGESCYNEALPVVVAEMRRRLPPGGEGGHLPGVRAEVRDDAGAVCVFLYDRNGKPLFANRDGSIRPMIIQKSDGGYNYETTDLAALRYRVEQLGADRILYVVDVAQSPHFEMLFAAARAAGFVPPQVETVHVQFGMVLGKDGKRIKTRAGRNVKLHELLDEAEQRAYELLASRERLSGQSDGEETDAPEALGEEQKRQIASKVGIAAVKYADLRNDRRSNYVFDWDKMISFQGNTAPYMMYAYARIRSIYRKAAQRFGQPDVYAPEVKVRLEHPAERALALRLVRLRETLDAVAADLLPHVLCAYLYELAADFMRFYESCPVLHASETDVRLSRMRLCDLTARTLKLGLGLLGIEVIERM